MPKDSRASRKPLSHRRIVTLVGVVLLLTIIIAMMLLIQSHRLPSGTAFPTASAELSDKRQAILAIAQAEYENPQKAIVYSEGVKEPWCADFVSWVFREAGYPFENPNTGSWRIPGTMTLLDYFREIGVWQEHDAAVKPQPGDVVIYNHFGYFGQHANIVVFVEGDIIITIDGNRSGGIGLSQFDWTDWKANTLGFARID